MMAESAKIPFDSPDWIFEIKLDGYRAITVFDDAGRYHLWSRNGLPLEQKFPAIAKVATKLKLRSTVLDGEIVAVDEGGIPPISASAEIPKTTDCTNSILCFRCALVRWCGHNGQAGTCLNGNPKNGYW
jgi:hypothetical protein